MICLLCGQSYAPEISYLKIFSLNNYTQTKLCPHCLAKFERLSSIQCRICSKNLEKEGICSDCEYWQKKYHGKTLKNHAIFRYNLYFHDLMVQYKRYGDYILKDVLAELCKKELKKLKADLYVPIPTSPEHQKRRQFDTISAIYADILPLTPLLIKEAGLDSQGEKNKQERLKTGQGFLLAKKVQIRENLNIRKIVLLDDIYTTGRTLYHARDKVWEHFPDSQIESFSICR
ncbi:ComF family protein [Lactobacillus sp. LL6]|uniref:ComF family protein n=1 Tax=Lactobacillus sp. LL6 TaxID=2596827 RepID=UPI001186981B|nr:ComF family protein [Lactobacillus sp. LL6]TSO26013.1 ComF family protein [Lactobacillus sp. LL6]